MYAFKDFFDYVYLIIRLIFFSRFSLRLGERGDPGLPGTGQ